MLEKGQMVHLRVHLEQVGNRFQFPVVNKYSFPIRVGNGFPFPVGTKFPFPIQVGNRFPFPVRNEFPFL